MSSIPTVYFIDDSATMREVIKIAFRRENINVVACHDAASALGEIEKARPDVVITDVIMPEKDGYEVCQYIKNHPGLAKTPVILMSGVVNRAVAEKAFAVKADELLRKPFQPQDLITRVKHLLKPNGHPVSTAASSASAAAALSTIFSAASSAASSAAPARPASPAPRTAFAGAAVEIPPAQPIPISSPRIAPPAASSAPALVIPAPAHPTPAVAAVAPAPVIPQPPTPAPPPVAAAIPVAPTPSTAAKAQTNGDTAKLKIEVMRLEGLVKKLQSELAAEREYARALEEHVKTLQETE